MTSIRSGVRVLAAAAIAGSLLAGCAGAPAVAPSGAAGPSIPAPTLKVGDRWVYQGKDGYRQAILWKETHEITAVAPDGITVKITGEGNTGNFERTETWSAPGVVRVGAVYESETDRFDPPLIRFKYPLTQGETWSQSVRNLNHPPSPYGPIQREVTVGGYESVTTPAGTYNAIKMRIFMQLDDETFYKYATQANYLLWYAPEVNAWVKQEQRSYSRSKDTASSGLVPGQNATVELVSYTPAPR